MSGATRESSTLSRTLRLVTSPAQPLPSSSRRVDVDGHATKDSALADVVLAAQLPVGVSREMAEWFIVSAERAGEKLVNEATKSVPWPRELLDNKPAATRVLFLARDDNVNIFEHLTKATPPQRSLWGVLRPRRSSKDMSKQVPTEKPTTRVFGTTHLYATIQHVAALLGPRSSRAASLLHPDASLMLHVHTLLDVGQEHACLRTVAMPPTVASAREPRDFLVVEYRNQFQRPADGRKGFVVAYHSVGWSGSPSATVPEAVRASAYTSGIVALESETIPGRVELYGVAEINLKGDATVRDNAEFARHRVELMLARTAAAIEQSGLAALALDDDSVFEIARRTSAHRQQRACVM